MALDRTRLARVLEMAVGSDQDGEKLAALHIARQMLKAAGVAWADVLKSNDGVDQAAYQLLRASMDAERRNLDNMAARLRNEREAFERERDLFYMSEAYQQRPQQARQMKPDDDTLTMEKLKEAMRKAGVDPNGNAYVDPFAPYTANQYAFYRETPNYEQQRVYEEEDEQTGGKTGWTEKTMYDDVNRQRGLHDGATEAWEKWAKVDVTRAGWILGHRYTNQVAQQAFAFVCKHGRLHPMQQQTIDVYMRHGR